MKSSPASDNSLTVAGLGVAELSVVIPTLNERDNIHPLIERLAIALLGIAWEIVFVDDDSTDGTAALLHEISRRDARVRSIRRWNRRGLSSAVVEGIQSTSTPYIAVMDADLQHDERLLSAMLAKLRANDADIVVGSRYIASGNVGAWDQRRRWISKIATYLAQLVVKADLSDPMSGFFMVRRDTFDAAGRRLSAQGYKILLDIVASSPQPPRIAELPYEFGLRRHGESKLNTLVMLEYLGLLIEKLFGDRVPARFVIFGMIGAMGVLVHFAVLAVLLKGSIATFVWAQSIATFVAMTFNFFVNNNLTYRDRRLKGAAQLIKGLISFYAICSIGTIANVGIANVLFRESYAWWLAALAGVLVGALWNYVLTSVYTWKAT